MKKLYVEIADTPLKREYGLMDRKTMSENHGMLFKFPYKNNLSFWMRDTYLPLQIAFINDDGKILQIEEMIPLSTRAILSNKKCKYALEVNNGWFDKNNVGVGDYIGGHGLNIQTKIAQTMPQVAPQVPQAEPPMNGMNGMTGMDPQMPGQPLNVAPQNPEVMMKKTYKERLEEANLKGDNLIILYITKDEGDELPPKSISPPFTFEDDADGKHDAVVKAWDNQDGQWKSFLIDNIRSLEKEEKTLIEQKEI